MTSWVKLALLLSTLGVQYCLATTTVSVPIFNGALLGDIEGVDADGHTTWRLGPTMDSSGSAVLGQVLFTSATLVVSPTDVHFVENDPDISFAFKADCGIDGSRALCTLSESDGDAGGGGGTQILSTQSVGTDAFNVQVLTAAPSDATGTLSAASSGAGSGAGSGTTPTASSTSVSPTATQKDKNGAGKARVGASVFGLVVIALGFRFC
ncbi:hypothetical protein C8Q79DRAFT_932811 [Trametes meyenii]|nr:hypothetical protein C8Q79DRAFT_932811 [Trametes meyenii]